MHHEFYQLAKTIANKQNENHFALATVFYVRGSAYRREGTRMIIETSGNWQGNISGGCLEGDILHRAKKVIETGKSILVTYDTRQSKNKEIRVALGCNGIIDILIEPVTTSLLVLSKQIIHLFEQEKTAFLTTEINLIKNKVFVSRELEKDKPLDFPIEAMENENFCQVEKSEFKIKLNEVIGLQRKIVIWGTGPDAIPLARFSSQMGWKTIIASDCEIPKIGSDLAGVETVQTFPDHFFENISVHENTAVILVSHDFYNDFFILEKVIQQNVKYIGIMGPKRRGARMVSELKENHPNVKVDENKLFYPVGLDIGSDNPVEIALSIIAEVQSVFSKKNAAPLKEKSTRIHDSNSEETIEEFNPTDSICAVNHIQ